MMEIKGFLHVHHLRQPHTTSLRVAVSIEPTPFSANCQYQNISYSVFFLFVSHLINYNGIVCLKPFFVRFMSTLFHNEQHIVYLDTDSS